jgi:hypothetical protein
MGAERRASDGVGLRLCRPEALIPAVGRHKNGPASGVWGFHKRGPTPASARVRADVASAQPTQRERHEQP